MTKFAIITNTYKKPDGRTPELLTRAIGSILNQTHTDWKYFLIGDKYEDDQEFQRLASLVPEHKIKAVNRLNVTVERDLYPMPSEKLWCCAGGDSTRYGIELALKEGYEFICKLDHDDWWDNTHLSCFNNALIKHPDLFFLASRSHYRKIGNILPKRDQPAGLNYYPLPEKVINASTCIKYSETSIRSRNVLKETGVAIPGDKDLWIRLTQFMKANNKQGYLNDSVTCYHIEEGSASTHLT